MTRTRGIASQAGFTLIESMIAMFFVSFMAAELGMVMTYASRVTNLSQRITRACALADEAVERTRNTAYDNIQFPIPVLNESCEIFVDHVACTSRLDGDRFVRVRSVWPKNSSFPPGPAALTVSKKADVDVTVSFTDARGNAQQVRVASIVTKY